MKVRTNKKSSRPCNLFHIDNLVLRIRIMDKVDNNFGIKSEEDEENTENDMLTTEVTPSVTN